VTAFGPEPAGELATRSESVEERYRQLLDSAPDAMVVVDTAGTISFVNRQTVSLFGYEETELLGQKLEVLLPARFRATHAAHMARYFIAPQPRTMGSGLELFGEKKDGTEVQIEVSLSPVQTRTSTLISAAIRDISERKRIELAAKTSAERLASAVECIEDPLAIFDATDRLVMCNSAYRKLAGDGVSGATVLGQTYSEILDGALSGIAFADETERTEFRAQRLATRSDIKGMFDIRTKNGRSLRVTNRRTFDGGIVQTAWDLTDTVRQERELHSARIAAEAGSEAKSEFLASMSHELRTPLNAILGFAQLLYRDKREPLSPRHRERADQIIKGGEHLLRLIDDILDLSRIEAGGISISTEAVSVAEVLAEVRTTLSSMAIRFDVALEIAAAELEIAPVAADRTRLAQILMNFCSNAIKYNRTGGTATMTTSQPDPDHVRITVTDTGVGIPEGRQHTLFQPFQRAGQETGPIEGTGIGLMITKRLAELMGGSVGFRSIAGLGSDFWVELPIYTSGRRSSVPPPPLSVIATHLDEGPRRCVVYVEDNPANVAFMRDLLSSFDAIKLRTAPTAELGLELIRAVRPDVVIMDINLPGMSGLQALAAMRADSTTRKIPVVALTAAASERDKMRGLQAGFFRYLTKPVKVDEFIAALDALLNLGAEVTPKSSRDL
jgi:PAS domain S-box-containing protein